jgi:hypothetical protein
MAADGWLLDLPWFGMVVRSVLDCLVNDRRQRSFLHIQEVSVNTQFV